ncbi:MAG: hypothetical protein H7836_01355 [Magnetococcus sp. YQC-3]
MPASPKAAARERRTLRIIYGVGSVALLFFFTSAWLVRWVVDVERFRPAVISTLEKITGHPISLEELLPAPTEGLFTLELRNLTIHANAPSDPPLLLAKKVQIGLSPSFFFAENPAETPWKISSLTFTNPQVNIVQQEDTWLAHLLQEAVEKSDRRMRQQLGWGLTHLAIQSIKIHNGMLTLLDWEHAAGHSLRVDRIHGDIHSLSAAHASPVSLSARFQSVPFTLSGQIGPLPESLDLADMPLLLNLEAKSTQLSYFIEFFTSLTNFFMAHAQNFQLPPGVEAQGARGYFSTLFNGSLKKGLQTRSRLELDKLILTEKKPQPATPDKPAPAAIPSDLALRQKSILKDEQGNPLLQIEECFLYVDGKPILDLKGMVHDTGQKPGMENLVNLTLSTLNSVDLNRFSRFLFPFLSAEAPQGMLQLQGTWPNALQWNAHLDLTHTTLSFPLPGTSPAPAQTSLPRGERRAQHPVLSLLHTLGIDKQAGVPLFLDLELAYEQVEESEEENLWRLKELLVTRPSLSGVDNSEYRLRLSGTLQPTTRLEMSGEWELSLAKEYLPRATHWNLAGLARWEGSMTLDRPAGDDGEEPRTIRTLDGQLRMESGRLVDLAVQNFSTRIKQEKRQLLLSELETDLGLGRLAGHILLDLSDPKQTGVGQATYQALFAFAGIALEQLTEASQSSFVGLSAARQASKRQTPAIPPPQKTGHSFPPVEGVAFGNGEIRGQLDEHWNATEPFSGLIHLEIEPGRITGVDTALLLRTPGHPQIISGKGKLPPSAENAADKSPTPEERLVHKALYWDRLTTDLLWHNSIVLFDNLQIHSAGLQMTGNGEWRESGLHRFDLMIQSPLKKPGDLFAAQLEGDRQQTIYRPKKEPAAANIP